MNEIDKLKIEHARYKKALECIVAVYADHSDAHKHSHAALNPPPPPPATLETLRAALEDYNRRANRGHYISFFADESGFVSDSLGERRVFSFYSFQECLESLTAATE